jgi:hypothetical protein
MIEDLGNVLADLLRVFSEHAEPDRMNDGMLATDRFYKIVRWDPPVYDDLLERYELHVAVVERLAFLATQYSNLIAEWVRSNLDSAYRFEQGVLTVRIADGLRWSVHRPEFRPGSLTAQARYEGVEAVEAAVEKREGVSDDQ